MKNRFQGWYFKCENKTASVALIPAVHCLARRRCGSLQILTAEQSYLTQYNGKSVILSASVPTGRLGENTFSAKGITVHIHERDLTVKAELRFENLSPLQSDIMGPFQFLPFMECCHRVVSMRHTVYGKIRINQHEFCFDPGVGYLEGDCGRSFPKAYLWTQCTFPHGSLMLSVGEIRYGGVHFIGIIGFILLHGEEYRIATYLGARLVFLRDGTVVIRQKDLLFTASLHGRQAVGLQAPVNGKMHREIRENIRCSADYQLCRNHQTLLSLHAENASFEYEFAR